MRKHLVEILGTALLIATPIAAFIVIAIYYVTKWAVENHISKEAQVASFLVALLVAGAILKLVGLLLRNRGNRA